MPGPDSRNVGSRTFRRELDDHEDRIVTLEDSPGGGGGGEGAGVTVEGGGDFEARFVERLRLGAGLTYEPITDGDEVFACLRGANQIEIRGPEENPDAVVQVIEIGDGLILNTDEAGIGRVEVDPDAPDRRALDFEEVAEAVVTDASPLATLNFTAAEEDTVLVEADVIGSLVVEAEGEEGPTFRPVNVKLMADGDVLDQVTVLTPDDRRTLFRLSTTGVLLGSATDNGNGTFTWEVQLVIEAPETLNLVNPAGHLSARIV